MKPEYHRLKSWADRLKAGESFEQIALEMTRFLRDLEKRGMRTGVSDGIDSFLKNLQADVKSAIGNLDWYQSEGYAKWQERLKADAINAMIENVKMQTSDDQKKTNCAVFEASIRPILVAKQAATEGEAMVEIAALAERAFDQLIKTRTRKF